MYVYDLRDGDGQIVSGYCSGTVDDCKDDGRLLTGHKQHIRDELVQDESNIAKDGRDHFNCQVVDNDASWGRQTNASVRVLSD